MDVAMHNTLLWVSRILEKWERKWKWKVHTSIYKALHIVITDMCVPFFITAMYMHPAAELTFTLHGAALCMVTSRGLGVHIY